MAAKTKQKFTSIMLRPDPQESKLIEAALKKTGEAAATKAIFKILTEHNRLSNEFHSTAARLESALNKIEKYEGFSRDLTQALRFFSANKT